MENFKVQAIKESDAEEIRKFKNLYYHGQDPIEKALPEAMFQTSNTDLIIKGIETGFALKVIENESGNLVGFVLGIPTDCTTERVDRFLDRFIEAVEKAGDNDTANILHVVNAAIKKAGINGRYPRSWKKIQVRSLSVHPHYRGKKLGQKLLAAGIEEARKQGFDLITAVCSSLFSAKIAANLGMDHISTLTYQEFYDSVGRQVFTPIEPHSELRSYVLKL